MSATIFNPTCHLTPTAKSSEQVNCALPAVMSGNTVGLQSKQEAGAETKCPCSF